MNKSKKRSYKKICQTEVEDKKPLNKIIRDNKGSKNLKYLSKINDR